MTNVTTAGRLFQYSGLNLPDPDPKMSPQAVKDYYQMAYPELVNATVEDGQFDGHNQVFTFRRAVGTKG